MKTRIFYFFGLGICALLLLLLLTVQKDNQKPQLASQDPHKRLIKNAQILNNKKTSRANTLAVGDNSRKKPMGLKKKNPDANAEPITIFQYITDKLNEMGITANGVEIDLKSGIVKWTPDSKWGEYYGDSSSKSQAILPAILKLHQILKTDPQAIRGCYQTKWGLLRLYIKDDIVAGTFNYYGRNHILGKLKDNILVGLWIKPANKNRQMLVGPIQFAFAKDWTAFRSVWRFPNEPQFNNRWVGKKIKCPARGTKLTQIFELGGPGVPNKAKPGRAEPGSPTGGKIPQKRPPSTKQ